MKGSRTKYSSGFDPKTIPGCSLWLDAADRTTLSFSGSNVTQWRDKSGTGNHYATGGAITHSNNALVFPGNATLSNTNPINFSAGTTPSMSTFVVVSTPDGSQERGIFQYGQVSCSKTGYAVYVFVGNEIHCTLYCGDLSVRNAIQTNTRMLVADVVSYSGTPGSLSRAGWFNGAPMSVTNATTTGVNLNLNSSSVIGNVAGGFWNGTMHEILYFNRALSTVERQQVEGYLAAKWGTLTTGAAVPATHPYATFPPTLRPFGPTDVSGCILWLDAADRKTLFQDSGGTQPITAVGQSIGLWRDKSSRGYLMTVPSGKSAPTYGSNVINTTGTNALWSTTNFELTGNAKLTLFFVFACSVASGYNTSCAAWIGNPNGPVGGKIIGLGIAVQGLPDNYQYYVPSTFSSAELNTVQPRLAGVTTLTMTKYDGTTVFGNYNGTSLAPSGIVAAGGANWAALPFQTGLRSANAGGSADGFMCEVLCYNDALSTLQIQQIEGYLARKWGLNSSVAVGHPYRFGLPPLTAEITPRAIPGCSLWLDAADSSTLTLSGSTVTAWADKSGNGRTATAQSAASYSAANNALSFTSGNYYSFSNLSFAVNSYFSFFIVERLQSSSSFPHLLGTDNQSLHVRYNGTGNGSANASAFRFAFHGNDLDAQNIPAFTTADAQPIRVWSLVFTTSFRGIYLNGTLMASDANNTQLSSWNTPLIGRAYDGYYYTGFLYEVLGFGGQMSTAYRQQIEGYLAWKWGLQDSLPGGHPFRMLKP